VAFEVVRSTIRRVAAVAGAPGTAGQETAPARTAWGAPDLNSTWDYSSLTPMVRPPQFEGKAVLSEEDSHLQEWLR